MGKKPGDPLRCRRITSVEQKLGRLSGEGESPRPDEELTGQQAALFDARWHGVQLTPTGDVPVDRSAAGRARAVEAYGAGMPQTQAAEPQPGADRAGGDPLEERAEEPQDADDPPPPAQGETWGA